MLKKLMLTAAFVVGVVGLSLAPLGAQVGATSGFDKSKSWGGNGSEHLPCEGNEHWILSPTGKGGFGSYNVTSASVFIDGVETQMIRAGGGFSAYHADTNVGFDGSQTVEVKYNYTGSWYNATTKPFLKLSHCDEEKEEPREVEVCDPQTGEIITVPENEEDKYLPVDDEACEEDDDKDDDRPVGGRGGVEKEKEEEQIDVPEVAAVDAGAGPAVGSAVLGLFTSITAVAGVATRKLSAVLEN